MKIKPGQTWRRKGGEGIVKVITVKANNIVFEMASGNQVGVSEADFLRLFVKESE
jgi:hypothetical protein